MLHLMRDLVKISQKATFTLEKLRDLAAEFGDPK